MKDVMKGNYQVEVMTGKMLIQAVRLWNMGNSTGEGNEII